jgi:hypothetical protein
MAGAPGAAFIAASFIELQDAPIDVCNLFHGEVGAFGIFTEKGVPQKSYQALRAFQGLIQTPRRVETRGALAGKLAFAAGLSTDMREATMLVVNFADPRSDIVLNWKGFAWTSGVTAEIRSVDAVRDFSEARTESVDNEGEGGSLRLTLKAPSIAWIRLRPTDGAPAKVKLSITEPANRLVFQRSHDGNATIPVAGSCAWPGAVIEARLLEVASGKVGDWKAIGTVPSDYSYRGEL